MSEYQYIGNLRGPKGHDAVGAEASDAAVGDYIRDPEMESAKAVVEVMSDSLGRDLTDYSFNANDTTLGKWRAALAAAAGAGTARITVSGDSTPWGSGSGNAHLTSAWPGRLQRMFEERYGKQGTGFMPMLLNYGHSGAASEQPVLAFSTSGVTESSFGVYALGTKKIVKSGTDAWVQLSSVFGDVFRVSFISSPGNSARVIIDGVDVGNIRTSTSATSVTFAPLSGYATRQIVTDIPAGGTGYHSIRIVPEGSDGTEVHLAGIESYTSPSRGVVVSNVSLSGITSEHLVLDDATLGQSGMSVGFDLPRSHLHIIHIGTNDWQQHYTVADFKARLVTAVRRARTATPVANGGTTSNGDTLLVVNQWVDTTSYPADHVNSPANDLYMTAVREVAVEEGAAGLDLRLMASSFSDWNAKGFAADGLHPSPLGHEAIAAAVFRVLDRF